MTEAATGILTTPHFGPKGETDDLSRVEVLFSRPMVLERDVGKVLSKGPIEFVPDLSGQFEWVTPRAVQFLPESPIPGTAWSCRIPAGTRALDGSITSTDESWRIDYHRPQWTGSWLDETESGHDPWQDPFWLEFDRPASADESSLRFVTARGTIPAQILPIDTFAPNRLSFRPATPLEAATTYDLVLDSELNFEGGELTLADNPVVRFRTPSPTRILQGAFNEAGQIVLHPSFAVAADSLRGFLQIEPTPPTGFALHNSGKTILIEGEFPPGESLHLQVRPGFRNVFGLAADRPLSLHLQAPHNRGLLQLSPSGGTLIPGPREYLRLESSNVGEISLRAAWLDRDTYPRALALRQALSGDAASLADTLALDGSTTIAWQNLESIGASDWSDSLHVYDLVVARIPDRPDDVQGLWIEATSTTKFDEPERSAGESVRTDALLQFGPIGVSAFSESRHSLFWVTDLITGRALKSARVSMWTDSAGVLSRGWQGRSDTVGLVWGPGSMALAGPEKNVRFVLAEHENGATWLQLPGRVDEPETASGADMSNATISRAAIVTDRKAYAPGDIVRWKAYVREVSVKGLVQSNFPRLIASMTGERWKQSRRVHLNTFGATSGQFRLPERTGRYALELYAPARENELPGPGTLLGSRELTVVAADPPPLELTWQSPGELHPSEKNIVRGRVTDRSGRGVRHASVEWSTESRPVSFRYSGWEGYQFGPRTGSARTERRNGELETDKEGNFSVEIDPDLARVGGQSVDAEIILEGTVSGLDRLALSSADTLSMVASPLRLGLKDRSREPNTAGTLSWEWICVDTSGALIADIDVEASLWRESEDGSLIELAERSLVSDEKPQTIAFPRKGTERVFLRLETDRKNAPLSEAWGNPWSRESSSGPYLTVETQAPETDGWTSVRLPQTPPSGATTLWVLHQQELLSSRVLEMSSSSTVDLAKTPALPGQVRATAIQIGSDPSAARHGGAARSQRPRYRMGETTFAVDESAWQANLDLELDPPYPTPGDTASISFRLRDRLDRPCRGEVTLAILESPPLPLPVQRTAGESDAPAFLEAFGDLFAAPSSSVRYTDTRQSLQRSGNSSETPALEFGPGGVSENPEHSPNPAAEERTFYWNISIPTNDAGEARLRFVLPEKNATYRFRAYGATVSNGAGGFAVAERRINASNPLFVDWDLPSFARPEDSFNFEARILGSTNNVPELRLSGAALTDVRTDQAKLGAHTLSARATVQNPSSVRFELRPGIQSADQSIEEVRLPIDANPIERTSVIFGAAGPRAEEILDLEAPEVLGASGLELQLSPTRQSELGDALHHTLNRTGPGIEPRLSRIRAYLLAEDLVSALSWSVDSLQVDRESAQILWRLAPSGDLSVPLSSTEGDQREAIYLDAYAFSTWGRLGKKNRGLEQGFYAAFERRMERNLRQLRGADRVDFDLLAFTLLAVTEYGREVDPDAPLRWLLARDTSLSLTGKLLLALALDARAGHTDRPLDRSIHRQVVAWMDVLLVQLEEAQDENGLLRESVETALPYAVGRAGDIRASALALRLLTQRSPNHALAGSLFRALLENRSDGHWGTPHGNVLASEALHAFLNQVEQLRLPAQGRVVLGLTKTEGVRFTETDPSPKTLYLSSSELARIRRTDPSTSQLRFRFETERLQTLAYQLRFPDRLAAITAPARDDGLGVFRRYTDLQRGRHRDSWKRGDLVDVEIVVTAATSTGQLWLREPIPAGATLVHGLSEAKETRRVDIPLDPSTKSDELVWLLPPLETGIHVYRYRILCERKGLYGVPGSIVAELHGRDRWGRAAASRISID